MMTTSTRHEQQHLHPKLRYAERIDLLRNEQKKNSEVSMAKMKAEHQRKLETMREDLETELRTEMSGRHDNLGEMEATQRQLAEDLNVARLAESREVKQVNALTEALSICREIERKQRTHALEEANELKQLRESNLSSTATLNQELETERRKVKKLEEDLVQACASVAAYQTKLSRFENQNVSSKSSSSSSSNMWNMFRGNEESVETTPKKKEEEEEEEKDLIDFGDSPIVTKKKVEEENDLQGDDVVRKTVEERKVTSSSSANNAAVKEESSNKSSSGWGFGNLFSSANSVTDAQEKVDGSVEIDVLFGKGPMGIELKPLRSGGTYVVRLSKPSLLGDTSWALKYNQYILKKVGDRKRLLVPGMRPVSVNGKPLPKTLKEVAKIFKSTKRPMKIKFLPPLR